MFINHPIKPQKEKAWHNFVHPYFTKQASNVVREYIKNHTKEGDSVLDPFCGTGVTAIEALTMNRKAIMVDINPLACFITEQTIKKINTDKLSTYFTDLSDNISKEIIRVDKSNDKEIEREKIPFWYPRGIRMPLNADFEFVEELWSKKQLIALSILYNAINKIDDPDIKNQMKMVFSAFISTVNLTYMPSEKEGKKVGGGGPSIFGTYRYWRPKDRRELPVWNYFYRRFNLFVKAKKIWNEQTHNIDINNNYKIINGSALELDKYLNENSIDYIYTDPPYGGNIAYLDLSTMWNAWLGFQVTEDMKKDEIIEGGDLQKTQDNYTHLFSKSFEQMGRVLKKDGWLSCVFAHKKLEYWNVIIDSCEDNGMEFIGSTYQPTNNSSIHYKKNPSNVLCSQRIANFKKTFAKAERHRPDDLEKFIINEMERACIETNGASIDNIYQRVLDQLLRNKTLSEAKKKGYLKLDQFLEDTNYFVFDNASSQYFVKREEDTHKAFTEEYFKRKGEIKLCLIEMLSKNRSMTIDQIHKELFDIFSEDKRFPVDKDLEELLSEVAYKNPKSHNWSLISIRGEQVSMDFDHILSKKIVKIKSDGHSHSEVIFRLVQIGNYLGFNCWIGKREQSKDSFQGFNFDDISYKELPLKNISKKQKDKIQQIDVIWFDKTHHPRYAFEIEESTSIVSGLDRFKYLLEHDDQIANHLFIVAPKSRERKLIDVFTESTYVGHPLYMENKVKFIFNENLIKFYDEHLDDDFNETDLKVLFESLK